MNKEEETYRLRFIWTLLLTHRYDREPRHTHANVAIISPKTYQQESLIEDYLHY